MVFGGGVRPALAVASALGAGVLAYAAIFTWLALITTRALPFALIYVLLWEGVISTFMNGVDYLSVRGYTLAIMSGLDKSSFPALEDRVIEFPVAVAGAATVTVMFWLLGVRRLRRRGLAETAKGALEHGHRGAQLRRWTHPLRPIQRACDARSLRSVWRRGPVRCRLWR